MNSKHFRKVAVDAHFFLISSMIHFFLNRQDTASSILGHVPTYRRQRRELLGRHEEHLLKPLEGGSSCCEHFSDSEMLINSL